MLTTSVSGIVVVRTAATAAGTTRERAWPRAVSPVTTGRRTRRTGPRRPRCATSPGSCTSGALSRPAGQMPIRLSCRRDSDPPRTYSSRWICATGTTDGWTYSQTGRHGRSREQRLRPGPVLHLARRRVVRALRRHGQPIPYRPGSGRGRRVTTQSAPAAWPRDWPAGPAARAANAPGVDVMAQLFDWAGHGCPPGMACCDCAITRRPTFSGCHRECLL